MKAWHCLILLAGLAGCATSPPSPPVLTVSGVSSGGYMALQMQAAYSDRVAGAAAIAAGPYDCAEGNILNALGACIKGPPPARDHTIALMRERQIDGGIAPLTQLRRRPVWLLHGRSDDVVDRSVVERAAEVFQALDADVRLVTDVLAAHGMPTVDYGAPCDQMQSPFLNGCGYDAAGALLKFLHGRPVASTDALPSAADGRLVDIPQPPVTGFAELAKAYVPVRCADRDACDIHVAFHGCQQAIEFVGESFVANAGYNAWADQLGLIVLYPQIAASQTNPLGCWDWWGYSGSDYALREAPQMRAVLAMVDSLRTEAP